MIYRILYSNGEVGCQIFEQSTAYLMADIMTTRRGAYPVAMLKIKMR